MSDKKKKRRSTLADAIDATEWDFTPGKDRKILLKPAGAVFGDVPWEVEPQYLGPAPIAEVEAEIEAENGTDDDADTQPLEPLNE
jgi:hypothetical protein